MPYSSLIVQLEVVIIEMPTLQARRLRTQGNYTGPNICYQWIWPVVTQDFSMAKLIILAWRYVCNCILENQIFCWTTADLSYDQRCDTSSVHTHVIPTCSSGTLYTAYRRYTDNKLHLFSDSELHQYQLTDCSNWVNTDTQFEIDGRGLSSDHPCGWMSCTVM